MIETLTNFIFWTTWIVTTIGMEFWSRFLHRQVWHRKLWFAHRSHHEPSSSFFEFNDIFSSLHAIIAMTLIIVTLEHFTEPWKSIGLGLGLGMTTFGISYFLIHDGYIHKRLPLQFLDRFSSLKKIKEAHYMHHQSDSGGPYGLFLGPHEKK